MKTSIEEILLKLREHSVTAERSHFIPDGIRITSGNLPKSAVYREGLATIQDESSMLVGYAVDPEPGELV
jgi:16S rRNA (cytosine967-C5)-methyltransferase